MKIAVQNTVQYSTVQYITVQKSTEQYSTVQYWITYKEFDFNDDIESFYRNSYSI